MLSTDCETGEFVRCRPSHLGRQSARLRYDLETGEPECIATTTARPAAATAPRTRPRFNVPREMLTPPQPVAPKTKDRCACIGANESYSLFPKGQVLTLQEDIIMGYNKTSHRMFFVLVTLLYVFTRHVVALAVLIEYAMHRWAHTKNGQNSNPSIYYRSPLHIVTSRFCPACRVEVAMDRVIKMQDVRTKLWQLGLREVARNIT